MMPSSIHVLLSGFYIDIYITLLRTENKEKNKKRKKLKPK